MSEPILIINKETVKTPIWDNYKNQRVLLLWEVVALSLNVEPTKKNVAAASKDEEFQKLFETRTKLFSRMLSATPTVGYVTFVKNVEFNKNVKLARNKTVCVLSCIDRLLSEKMHSAPKEFTDLRETLEKIPLPGDSLEENIFKSLTGNSTAQINKTLDMPKTNNGRQTKANQTKKFEQLAAMFYALTCDCWGFEHITGENEVIALKNIEDAISKINYKSTRGFSKQLILEALKIGESKVKPEKEPI